MIRFYKKNVPATPVFLNGIKVKFDSLDRIWGFFATDNEWLHAQFADKIARQEAGLQEITGVEYDAEYLKKRGKTSPAPTPVTELRAGAPLDTAFLPVPQAADVESSNSDTPLVPEPKPEPEVPQPTEVPQVHVGKRRMRRRPGYPPNTNA